MQLAEKYDDEHSCAQKVDLAEFPNYHLPYEDLLKQLTSYQHAILIDLGKHQCINYLLLLLKIMG